MRNVKATGVSYTRSHCSPVIRDDSGMTKRRGVETSVLHFLYERFPVQIPARRPANVTPVHQSRHTNSGTVSSIVQWKQQILLKRKRERTRDCGAWSSVTTLTPCDWQMFSFSQWPSRSNAVATDRSTDGVRHQITTPATNRGLIQTIILTAPNSPLPPKTTGGKSIQSFGRRI
jgi:hypothetical protein